MRSLLAALLVLALLPAAAQAQTPAAPGAVTRPATEVGHRSATLTAEVDPNGAETTYVFQYGTTAAYGLETEARPAGDGAVAAPVSAPIADLSPSTLYHYRVVATNAEGSTSGEDATFTTTATPPNPQIPRVFWLRVQANSPTDPVVKATLNPRGAETTWRIEYGPTPALGAQTPDQTLPAGTAPVLVSATLPALAPATRVFWRVVATNAAGTRRTGLARFTTQRAPTGVTVELEPPSVPWGRTLAVRGQVLGTGVGGITVALLRLPHPFGAPFAEAATARAGADGRFAFRDVPLLLTTQFQVLARAPVPVASPPVTAVSQLVVTAAAGLPARRSVPVFGLVRPAVPNGLARLKRRREDGTWHTVRRTRLADLASYSRFRFTVPRRREPGVFRVVVAANDGGAHHPGTSRTLRVRARR